MLVSKKQWWRRRLVVAAALIMAFLLLFPAVSCPSDEPSDGNGNGTSVPWEADGVISSGEYSGSREFGLNYELHWRSDSQYFYAAIKARTTGWVAMAFQPEPDLKKNTADFTFGYVSGGKTIIFDLYATGPFGPHPADTDLGGSYDILESGGSEAGGFTIIEFKKARATGDEFDEDIVSGTNKILWAFGQVDDLFTGHIDEEPGRPAGERGYGEIII